MITHNNIVANILQSQGVELDAWTHGSEVMLSPLPMFHIYAFTFSLHCTLWSGNTLVTMERFDMERYCEVVGEWKCTRSHIVPPITLGLAKSPLVDKYDMSSLKYAISAAAPLGTEIQAEVTARTGITVKQAWGMSETSPIGTITQDTADNISSGTVGPPISNTYVKVTRTATTEEGQEGEALPSGEEGELCIKGPQVMKGYLNEPEKTAECMDKDGFFKTGDIAKIDLDGNVFITGRVKELIKYKGFQVAPAELEDVLCSNEAVKDCAIVARPHGDAGEVPRAYVVLNEGFGNITPEEMEEWTAERVAPFKKLRGGVVFTDAIPKSAAGKILRNDLVKLDQERDPY